MQSLYLLNLKMGNMSFRRDIFPISSQKIDYGSLYQVFEWIS